MSIEHAGYVGQIIKSEFKTRGIKTSDPFMVEGHVCVLLEFQDGDTVMVEVFPVKQIEVKNEPKPKTTPRWKE